MSSAALPCGLVLIGNVRLEVMSAGFIEMDARSQSQSMAAVRSGRRSSKKYSLN